MNRRDFFTTVAFACLSFFVRRETQAKLVTEHLDKLEGRTIPRGLYISQCVGRGKPMYPQAPIPTLHQKSVVEGYERRSVLEFEHLELGQGYDWLPPK